MDELRQYFPDLTPAQIGQLEALEVLYGYWNTKVNVISRKDIDKLYTRHVLHALGIAEIQPFLPGSRILDVGTGGGFPGIPLAILFPETHFCLVDSIGKKINVVHAIIEALGLKNAKAEQLRVENARGAYDFVVGRAVAPLSELVLWVYQKIADVSRHELENGILYLKGGDLSEALGDFPQAKVFSLSKCFAAPFFETKKLVHLPLKR